MERDERDFINEIERLKKELEESKKDALLAYHDCQMEIDELKANLTKITEDMEIWRGKAVQEQRRRHDLGADITKIKAAIGDPVILEHLHYMAENHLAEPTRTQAIEFLVNCKNIYL